MRANDLVSMIASLSLCSDGSRLSCCDVDHSAPQIPPLCHSGCFTNVCPCPFLYVSFPGSYWSPSASLTCSDPLDDGLFQAVVSDDVTKMFRNDSQIIIISICSCSNNYRCCQVFSSREMRTVSSNVYLLLLALSDSLYLLSVFLTNTLTTIRCLYFHDSAPTIFNRSSFLCKLLQHCMDMFSDYSTCLILAFTVERYIAIYMPIRFKFMCSVRRARIACVTIFVVICVSIAPYHFMYMGLIDDFDVCTVLQDYQTEFTALYIVESLLFRVIPVFIIALLNGMIIERVATLRRRKRRRNASTTKASQNNGQNNGKQRSRKADRSMQLTIILVLVSTSYIIVFIPVLVQFVLWSLQSYVLFLTLNNPSNHHIIVTSVNIVTPSNHIVVTNAEFTIIIIALIHLKSQGHSINQSIHFIPEYYIHIQILLSYTKTKLTRMHVHIANVSNAGAMGTVAQR